MCGEMASDPTAAPLLIAMGLDEFSVSPSSVPYVKDLLRSISFEKARQLLEHVMQMSSSVAIKKYMEEQLYDK